MQQSKQIYTLKSKYNQEKVDFTTEIFFLHGTKVNIFLLNAPVIDLLGAGLLICLACYHLKLKTLLTHLTPSKIKDVNGVPTDKKR